MKTVIIGLGSNVGDRRQTIKQAIHLLSENPMIEIEKISSLIETEPETRLPQPKYINGAIIIKTILSSEELLSFTQDIEKKLGRFSKGNYDPRTIDLDILFIDNEIICLEDLTVPHPLVHERDFTLKPLNEIIPNFMHPILNQSISSLHEEVVGY